MEKIALNNLPKFVKLLDVCLRLRGDEYWRDGGEWGVRYYIRKKDGVLCSNSTMRHLTRKELIPVTREEWKKCNGRYTPKGI